AREKRRLSAGEVPRLRQGAGELPPGLDACGALRHLRVEASDCFFRAFGLRGIRSEEERRCENKPTAHGDAPGACEVVPSTSARMAHPMRGEGAVEPSKTQELELSGGSQRVDAPRKSAYGFPSAPHRILLRGPARIGLFPSRLECGTPRPRRGLALSERQRAEPGSDPDESGLVSASRAPSSGPRALRA